MRVYTGYIEFSTGGNSDIKDITSLVEREISKSSILDGIVNVFSVGSTGSVTTIEYEPALVKDFKDIMQALIPADTPYAHNAVWGDANGHSHLRASIVGSSINVPLTGGSMELGTWQQIVFIDFDARPRKRKVVVKVLGLEQE